MRKVLFVISFGLALNCYASDSNGDATSSGGFFSGMHDIYNKVLNLYGKTPTDSSHPSNNLMTGVNAMDNDDYKGAIPAFKSALASDPNNKAAYIGLIRALSQSGNHTEAEKYLNTYHSKFGEDDQYKTERARDLAFTGHLKEAQAELDPLLQKDPTNDILLDIQQYIKDQSAANTTAATNPPTNTTSANILSNDQTTEIQAAHQALIDAKYAQGQKLLQAYKTKHGEDDAYLTEEARFYALTNQPDKSLAILKPMLEKDPNNSDLITIRDYANSHPAVKNQTGGGNMSAAQSAAQAKAHAERMGAIADANKTSSSYIAAADAYEATGDNKKSLEMLNKAVSVDPTNPNLLMKRAAIGNMVDDQLIVYDSFNALYATNPDNKEVILGLARAASRLGKTDQSTYLYSVYISRWPNEPKIWIEWAYNESWSGNDRAAVHALNSYYARFGGTDEYWIAKARIIASADRPREALCIINRMLPKYPDNYDLNYANATALYYNNQPIQMFQSLAKVNRLAPGTEETEGLNAFIWTPYRDNIGMDLYDSFDSDTVKISRATLYGQYYLSPLTFLLGNVYQERLSASIGSGLNPIEGGHAVSFTAGNIGINHRFSPLLALQGIVGGAHATDSENTMLYQGDAFLNFTDTAQADLMIKRNFYDQSARAVSVGVKQNLYQGIFNFQPCIQCYINVNGAYATFTDNNTMRFAEVNPAANIIATERWNIRMGVDSQWYKFGRHTGHGYYDPSNYHFYAFNTDIYLKQSDNIGYEFFMSLGTQKDETFATYTAANDVSGKAYIGIYQDWFLVFSAGASTRGRSIANNPTIGSYRVYNFDAALTRRL